MIFEFRYLDKQQSEQILPILFEILHSNMRDITPTGKNYEDDLKDWLLKVVPAMKKDARQIVLMYVDDEIAGFFQYYINIKTNLLMMEEIQIKREFQGSGMFSAFYRWFVNQMPITLKVVEAYSDKRNIKSQRIIEHLGLVRIEEYKDEKFFYYKGDYFNFINKYGNMSTSD